MADYTLPPPGDIGDSASDGGASGQEADGQASAGSAAATERPKRKRFVRRHWILVSLAVVFALVAATAGGALYWLNNQLSSITHVPCPSCGKSSPNATSGGKQNTTNTADKSHALNILLLGADAGNTGGSVAHDLKDGIWTPGEHRSDTIMIVHIPADRKSVQLISIPRDTWVHVDGYGEAKINAAFSEGGPDLAVKTVEQLTHIPIDHFAIIDWAGFKDLTTALGGVRIYIPDTFTDVYQHVTWHKGWATLEGNLALQYVRTRHGLADGDFSRIERQQNFLRAMMGKLLSETHNIVSMTNVVKVITRYLTIDDGWSNSEILGLAVSLRNIHTDDVQFITAPFGSYGTASDGESYVNLAPRASKRLFRDVKNDDIQDYLKRHPSAALSGDKSID